MKLQQWLESRWYADSVPLLLRPLSWMYGALMFLRARLYRLGVLRSGHAGVPVIMVGNIAVGGTGKTPLVMWLARQFEARGWRVGIVSRGHGGSHATRSGAARLISRDDDPAEVGDEPLLISRETGCPVAIGVRRLQAAHLLAARGCNLVLADDGLQHLALRRDVEIAVVDGQRGLGNGALLPAGPLRETASRLGKVDAVVVNGRGDVAELSGLAAVFHMQLQPRQFLALAGGGTREPAAWSGRCVHAVAGIGNPQRFFGSLRQLGMHPIEHPFGDHHVFRGADLAFDDDLDIVMTAKDAVKCAAFASSRMWSLHVTAHFDHDDAARLLQWLEARLAGKH